MPLPVSILPQAIRSTGGSPAAAGRKIRVLVVDDSVVIRRFLSRILSEDGAFEVVGYAANGLIAVARAAELHPDAITMDIEMPELDGLATVRQLRAAGSKAVIIMCSTLTSRGASTTIESLINGANDYVTKPSNSESMEAALETLRLELVPKIKQFFEKHDGRPEAPFSRSTAAASLSGISARIPARNADRNDALPPGPPSLPAAFLPAPRNAPMHAPVHAPVHSPIRAPLQAAMQPTNRRPMVPLPVERRKIVAIGVSTGGPTALMQVLPGLPANFPLPIVIVQHMPAIFTCQLADRLNAEAQLEVVEGAEGMLLAPGRIILAPGDFHMRLKRSGTDICIALDQGERENSCRPAVDVLFRSVVSVFGGDVLALILTGMGQDGLKGVEALKDSGAYIMAQDRTSSVVWGMPGAVVDAGLAHSVLPLDEVATAILRQVPSR